MAPLTEAGIQVVFTPEFVDDDIRQEGVLCAIEVGTFDICEGRFFAFIH